MILAAQQIAARITIPTPSTTSRSDQSIDAGFRITARPATPSPAPAIFDGLNDSFFRAGAASATQSGVV